MAQSQPPSHHGAIDATHSIRYRDLASFFMGFSVWNAQNVCFASAHRDTATLACDYPFSNRTDVYAAWRYDKVSDLNPGNSVGVGLRHKV